MFERFLFSFMGPPEIGDLHAPPKDLPPGPVARCTKCGRPYDEHEIVRDPGLTYTRCPAQERASRSPENAHRDEAGKELR